MFVDTSAIVAVLLDEEGASALVNAIDGAEIAITSPVVILEAAMVLSSRLRMSPDETQADVRGLLVRCGVAVCTLTDETATLAVDAFTRFGKGRRNSARLNLADCLSYACAKQHKVPLLYVGDDFAATDIASG